VQVVDLEYWKERAFSGGISNAESADSRNKAFSRAVEKLKADGLIGVWNNLVWLV
jgi:predicted NAD/FAD-dependent oxidoreductase